MTAPHPCNIPLAPGAGPAVDASSSQPLILGSASGVAYPAVVPMACACGDLACPSMEDPDADSPVFTEDREVAAIIFAQALCLGLPEEWAHLLSDKYLRGRRKHGNPLVEIDCPAEAWAEALDGMVYPMIRETQEPLPSPTEAQVISEVKQAAVGYLEAVAKWRAL